VNSDDESSDQVEKIGVRLKAMNADDPATSLPRYSAENSRLQSDSRFFSLGRWIRRRSSRAFSYRPLAPGNRRPLFAFALVAAGVIILRYREPDRHRAFRAPEGHRSNLTIITCVLLMPVCHITGFVSCMAGHRTVIYFTLAESAAPWAAIIQLRGCAHVPTIPNYLVMGIALALLFFCPRDICWGNNATAIVNRAWIRDYLIFGIL